MAKATKIVVPKATAGEKSVARDVIKYVGVFDGAAEALSRVTGQLKRTPGQIAAFIQPLKGKYKGAEIRMHQIKGKWTLAFGKPGKSKGMNKASAAAQKYWNRSITKLLPGLTKRSNRKVVKKVKVSKAQGAINSMVVSLTKRIRANKMTRAQVMEAVKVAIKTLGLK